jgi:hypothetical protein
MIEVEGMINNQPFTILIDSRASHSYVDPRVVESLHLSRSKHEKYWLVQLATGTKRKVIELVKSFHVDMKGLSTKVELNILSLGSYDYLIGMDWLDQHHALLDYHNKEFTCLDEEGNRKIVQGIPRVVVVREISAMQLKKCYMKGCQLFAAHVEEASRDEVSNIGDHAVLIEFEDVFQDIAICSESQTGKKSVDCTCPYSLYGHVAGPYHHDDVTVGVTWCIFVG